MASSATVAACVLGVALWMQYVVYDDWLHHHGPLRLVGSVMASVLTFFFVLRWQMAHRRRTLELLHSFETIAWANDRIRNALQAIECLTYVRQPEAMEPVRDAVNTIEDVLHEVLAQSDARSAPRDYAEPLSSQR